MNDWSGHNLLGVSWIVRFPARRRRDHCAFFPDLEVDFMPETSAPAFKAVSSKRHGLVSVNGLPAWISLHSILTPRISCPSFVQRRDSALAALEGGLIMLALGLGPGSFVLLSARLSFAAFVRLELRLEVPRPESCAAFAVPGLLLGNA